MNKGKGGKEKYILLLILSGAEGFFFTLCSLSL